MKILIDARFEECSIRLYGLTLTERIVRQLDHLGCKSLEIIVNNKTDSKNLIGSETDGFPIQINLHTSMESFDHLTRQAANQQSHVVALEGNGIYDERVLLTLIETESSIEIKSALPDLPLALAIVTGKKEPDPFAKIQVLQTTEMPSYIRFLRKSVEPILVKFTKSTEVRTMENMLFENTFKSGLEWIAIYGYRIPVRELTRFFAKTPVTPNHLTVLAVVFRWGSIPLLFAGWIATGLSLILAFVVLDSLDGKLARMTLRFTEWADWLDHGSVLPTRLGWYAGLGWHFSGGELSSEIALLTAATLLVIILDDINWVIAKKKFQKTLFDLTDLDAKVHLFTHRRNDMFVMLPGYVFGFGLPTFFFLCLWVFLTWIWHLIRILHHAPDRTT